MQSHSLVLRNPLDVPTHRCCAALDIILAICSLSRRGALWFHLLFSCAVVLSLVASNYFQLVIGGCFMPCQSGISLS